MADSPVQKALVLLKCLADYGEPIGVKRLAEDTGLNISTVHRLLRLLAEERMVSFDPQTRLYGIGTDCIRFAISVLGGDSLAARVRPVIADLAHTLQETCAYSVYEPDTFTKAIAAVERGPHQLGYNFDVGRRDGIHAGASGKAILAFLPDDDIETMFKTVTLEVTAENTIVDPEALRRDIAEIRARGYATSLGERVPGAGFGIGAPVYGPDGRVVGSVVVTVPLFRWKKKNLGWMSKAVMDCGRVLSGIAAAEVGAEAEARA